MQINFGGLLNIFLFRLILIIKYIDEREREPAHGSRSLSLSLSKINNVGGLL